MTASLMLSTTLKAAMEAARRLASAAALNFAASEAAAAFVAACCNIACMPSGYRVAETDRALETANAAFVAAAPSAAASKLCKSCSSS